MGFKYKTEFKFNLNIHDNIIIMCKIVRPQQFIWQVYQKYLTTSVLYMRGTTFTIFLQQIPSG